MLGAPAAVLSSVLRSIFGPISASPIVERPSFSPEPSKTKNNAPARKVEDKVVLNGGNVKVASRTSGGNLNGKRKTIKL